MQKILNSFKFLGHWVLNILGIKRTSKAQKDFLLDSNVRIGIYMALVIIGLEIWMLFRQIFEKLIVEYNPEKSFFTQFFQYTTLFWMMLLLGVSFLMFSVMYLRKNTKKKTAFLVNVIFGGVCALYPVLIFADAMSSNPIKLALTVAFYASLSVYGLSLILYAVYTYLKGDARATKMFVITMFAVVCLVFGARVSFSDFLGGKEIICFITMVVFVACLLVWKPYISILMLGGIFIGFYHLITDGAVASESEVVFQDGDKVNYVTLLIALIMVATSLYHQRARESESRQKLEMHASFDDITGLHNFRHFLEQAKLQMQNPNVNIGELMYVYVDIQNFKLVNDQLGFKAGNEFLKKVAAAIRNMFGEENSCRMGEDRFAVLAKREGIVDKLEALNQEVTAINETLGLTLIAGGRSIPSRDYDPRRAMDRAHYAASFLKGTRGQIFIEYDEKMSEGLSIRHYIARNIEKAIEQGWVRAVYQPIVWAKDGKLASCEALARWYDPNYGDLSPGLFVPILEDALLIHKLDYAIIEQVCRDLRSALDNKLPVVPVSVNFSRLDFEHSNPIETLNTLVDKYGIARDLIVVEITESALMNSVDTLKKAASQLRKEGYSLWLDDFGSGYSSLNVIKDFELTGLKLDGKFICDLANSERARTLVVHILKMADALGMRTLAEGVEKPFEADFLHENGCERLQGYYYGKPMYRSELYEKFFKIKNVH